MSTVAGHPRRVPARRTGESAKISDSLLDELLAGQDPGEVFRDGKLIDDLKKAVAERALDAAAWLPGTTGGARPTTTTGERTGVSRIMLTKARIEHLLLAFVSNRLAP